MKKEKQSQSRQSRQSRQICQLYQSCHSRQSTSRLTTVLAAGFIVAFTVVITAMFPGSVCAASETSGKLSYTGIKTIQLNTFGGNCTITATKGKTVEVKYSHTHSNTAFQPKIRVEENKLVIKEKFNFADKGTSSWSLSVPDHVAMQIKSISGDVSITGFNADIDAQTVSGRIDARDCRGNLYIKSINGELLVNNLAGAVSLRVGTQELEAHNLTGALDIRTGGGDIEADELEGTINIKAPAGDIRIDKAKGVFAIKSANGDITLTNAVFTKKSWLKAASGDVYVELAQPLQHELQLNSVSGSAILNYNGHPIEGFFQFKAMKDKGQMLAPFPFEEEEIVETWGKKFEVKSLVRELDLPKIYIITTTGKAILKEK